jgi:hypothetical protein
MPGRFGFAEMLRELLSELGYEVAAISGGEGETLADRRAEWCRR